jgi:flagellar basal body-associated protein FliL
MRKTIAITGAALTLAATGTVMATSRPQDETAAAIDDPHFVPMQEIAVPIIDGDRLDGSLRVKTVLSATDAAAAERVTAALPRLRSASLAAALEFSRLHASPMRAVDARMLSQYLTKELQGVESGVARALIVEVAAGPA